MKRLARICTLVTLFCLAAPPAARAAEENPYATTLGATSAQAVFSTYMAVASLADLFGSKGIDKKKAVELAGMYATLTEKAKESLTDLIDSGKASKDDETALQQWVIINDHLGRMATSIGTYAKKPGDDALAAYEKNRTKAWNSVSRFLGIEDAEETEEKPAKEESEEEAPKKPAKGKK